MEIIALSGYARSGKDEAAQVLVNEYGFIRVAFADKLREMLYQLNPIVAISEPRHCSETLKEGLEPISTTFYLQDVIDKFGWGGYKETKVGPEIRRLLQRLGTEAGRQTLWDSIWIDAALTGLDEDAKVVVTDARFVNEAKAVTERGGKVWRVTRKGIGPAVSADGSIHSSETSLDDWLFDVKLYNYGTVEEYHDQIRSAYEGGF